VFVCISILKLTAKTLQISLEKLPLLLPRKNQKSHESSFKKEEKYIGKNKTYIIIQIGINNNSYFEY